mmetsp:Transcript_4459/g.14092  ORF Transcript_4459/g.14092 Transcript_4459/m.14092 type:complete len:213 (+) Transcript_4459:1354-1992(+)
MGGAWVVSRSVDPPGLCEWNAARGMFPRTPRRLHRPHSEPFVLCVSVWRFAMMTYAARHTGSDGAARRRKRQPKRPLGSQPSTSSSNHSRASSTATAILMCVFGSCSAAFARSLLALARCRGTPSPPRACICAMANVPRAEPPSAALEYHARAANGDFCASPIAAAESAAPPSPAKATWWYRSALARRPEGSTDRAPAERSKSHAALTAATS